MILRIVKMSFHPDKVAIFLDLFARQRAQIRAFPGCTHLELWEALPNGHTLFTYSHWDSEAALEAYCQAPLFQETWTATKVLFNARPEAWSLLQKG
ncbi:Quinol monooxygenase YgiN [Chitinophaga costaii]|uniref:Quinol monooxygenase YgiN n=1 Tax=Chitinophaga costaii TaxID=1335309 RepID=A0A1C4EDP1_9BACT|nr:antibiotic biosynthesis monooxygenase family protein [Chitinophaga costaii]PUZ23889.1 antibiotic biosynthesis monooxygenase [Chitinophaga costaii]SCC41729.1 Quinol monooxygenase YgiN [Chitinophaga costaii]